MTHRYQCNLAYNFLEARTGFEKKKFEKQQH